MIKEFKYSTEYRYGSYYQYLLAEFKKYDYKLEGVVSKTFPAFLSESDNPILTKLMQTIDIWTITIMMMIDKVHNFKNIFKH